MKKILPTLIIGILIISGFGAAAINDNNDGKRTDKIIIDAIHISQPTIKEKNNRYVNIELTGAASNLMQPGKPILPVVTKIYTFPRGTKINDVTAILSDTKEQQLVKKIQPAPQPVPLLPEKTIGSQVYKEDKKIYSENELYPKSWYTYSLGVGINNNKNVLFLRIHIYPVRYNPVDNRIYYINDVDIKISYEEKEYQPSSTATGQYDLLIIAPSRFSKALQPLIEHKNNHGINTTLKTVEKIYQEYEGRDKPEQIKKCIYDFKETMNITYVLLVGGRKGQRPDWYVPVRETNNDDGWESGYVSDLYYADVYKYNETSGEWEFEDWDSNGNGVFAEWSNLVGGRDIIDYYPDVYVGRLACRYDFEVKTMVNKIIGYENGADPSWFKKMIIIAGDTFPNPTGNYYEGEMETGLAASYLEPLGFEIEKIWTSLGTFTGPSDVIQAFSGGAGIVHFAGHGNPSTWATHPPNNESWVDGLRLFEMKKLRNGDKTPVVVVGGCHNSQFNVTLLNIIKDILKYGPKKYFKSRFWYKEWVPECWAWWMASKPRGGSIATIGNTGLGYGYIEEYSTSGLGGWIEPRFSHAYGVQGKTILGEAHSQAITDYINIIDNVNSDQIDRKTIEEWVLLGDPSLMIGGYAE